jgi:hypothetical protein
VRERRHSAEGQSLDCTGMDETPQRKLEHLKCELQEAAAMPDLRQL